MRENGTDTATQKNILNEIGEILAAGYIRLLEEKKKSQKRRTAKTNAREKKRKDLKIERCR